MTQVDIATSVVDMTDTESKYKTGDLLNFRSSASRTFGPAIPEGLVVVTEVVDHGHATPDSPRFTYVVQTLTGGKQGTDDRELSEPSARPLDIKPQ